MKCSTMKKSIITNILTIITLCTGLIFANAASAQSSVWKVSKNNDVVYLGGTIHILPVSEFPLPIEFTDVYGITDSIVLETKLPEPTDTHFQVQMMKKMSYENGKKLTNVLSKSTYQQLKEYIAGHGANLKDLSGFKPGFIAAMMAMMEAQRSNIAGEGVDVYFNKLALQDHKSITYLETTAFQLDMLSNMGLGDEDNFIKNNLNQMKDFKVMFNQLVGAWRVGDDKKLAEFFIDAMKEDPKTFKQLITERNKSWIPQIEKMFGDNDKEFVLIGAGHLVGDKSVLALLRAKGFRVEQVK